MVPFNGMMLKTMSFVTLGGNDQFKVMVKVDNEKHNYIHHLRQINKVVPVKGMMLKKM